VPAGVNSADPSRPDNIIYDINTIGLPLRALMYERQKDMAILPTKTPTFRTKLTMAAEFIAWAADRLHGLGKSLWFVVDGAYARVTPYRRGQTIAPLAIGLALMVAGRLREDSFHAKTHTPR
jgi:hypothetical protein